MALPFFALENKVKTSLINFDIFKNDEGTVYIVIPPGDSKPQKIIPNGNYFLDLLY